jgi:tetratricopeptide (TPR) repeat protein
MAAMSGKVPATGLTLPAAAAENLAMRRLTIGVVILVFTLGGQIAWAQAVSRASPSEEDSHYIPPPAWKSVEIGNFYLRRKDYRGALSRYKEAIHTDPDYAPAYLQLGKVNEKLGRKRQALAAYRKYLSALPSEKQAEEAKDAHRAIRRLEREVGDARRALEKPRK